MDSSSWPATAALVTATAITTTTFLVLANTVLWPRRGAVLPNPLKTTLPSLPEGEMKALVYRPDQLPGARDVQTPYGSMRVYEFGPENGQKVLFIHGISTSCITLEPIASALAKQGCRVMLFDLFGRGFSDGVGDLPHDARLYVSQIALALASSSLAWTGEQAKLRVVGYSLGGGIAVHFANTFPQMVDKLVLLAPAGLIRSESFGKVSNFVFKSGLVPEGLLAHVTKKRLQQPIARSRVEPVEIEVAAAEAADPSSSSATTPLEKRVLLYVRWMVEHHVGFVPAFMSCIRHAPLTEQHEAWARLGERRSGSTAVLLAEKDEIIDWEAYEKDARALGLKGVGGKEEGGLYWRLLGGGHDFVMTHSDAILKELEGFW